MTAFAIRLIAILTMLTDHVGMVFFPQVLEYRMIGRVAFPLFAWLIANGYRHTKDLSGYFKRLGVLALVSQVPYLLAKGVNFPGPFEWNIFVTLMLGLLAIVLYTRIKYRVLKWLTVGVIALVGEAIKVDYGAYGVLLMVGFHLTYGRTWLTGLMMAILVTAISWKELLSGFFLRIYSIVAFPIIAYYDGQPGSKRFKWWFYWFYPVHLGLLYLVKIIL